MLSQERSQIRKSAFFIFISGASFVYSIAIGYSLYTEKMLVVTLLLCSIVGIAVLAKWVYKSN